MPTASDSIAEVLPAHLTHVKTPTPIICCKQTHTACGQMHLAVCFMPLFYFSPWFLFPRENSCWLYIGSPIGFCCPQKPEIQILSASCLCVTCHDLNSFLFVRCQILLTEYFLLRQSFSSELHFQFTFTVNAPHFAILEWLQALTCTAPFKTTHASIASVFFCLCMRFLFHVK